MEAAACRDQLDDGFRQDVLQNLIMKALIKECGPNLQGSNSLHKMYDIAIKLEQQIFEKATNKDDYVTKINQRLAHAKKKHAGASTRLSKAISSFADYECVNAVDYQVLIAQFQLMRLSYLPELIKLLEKPEGHCAHARSNEQLQKSRKFRNELRRMIYFLQMAEHEIMVHPKEKLINFMNHITQYMGQGIPYQQASASNSHLYSSGNTVEQMAMQSLLNQTANGSIDYTFQSSRMNQVPFEILSLRNSQKEDNFSMFNPASGVFQPNFPRGQFSENSQNSLLSFVPPEGPPLPKKARQPFSIYIDKENDKSSFANLRGTSQPNTTAFTIDHSPSTSLAPPSVSKEIEKPAKSVFLGTSTGNNDGRQSSCEADVTEVLAKASVAPDISPGAIGQPSNATKQPIERLIEAVQSMSPEALSSSIDDIASAINCLDRSSDVDLATFSSYTSQAINCHSDGSVEKVKLVINSRTSYPFNSTENYCAKRPKIESNHDLLDEIKKINQRFVETVIEVGFDSIKGGAQPEAKSGTVVRCTYKAVGLSKNNKGHFASATPVATLLVELLIPSDYPNSPPQCLDRLIEECSKGAKDLTEKAKLRFNCCIRALKQPILLEEMARAWDDCARSVVSELVHCAGGESFSSKYGSWKCILDHN